MPGDGLRALIEVMDRLRSPGGCPWDARQTHASLLPYLVEEAYEVVEAIESGDRDAMREELGDLLLQVAFHSRIAEEDPAAPWGIDDVAHGITDKLVRRHPHVFAGEFLTTADEVEARWHDLKAQEKGRSSVTEGIPESLPALLRAAKLLERSEQLDVPLPDASVETIDMGITTDGPSPDEEEAFGDLLLALVAVGRERGWDAEAALRAAVRRHAGRIQEAERS